MFYVAIKIVISVMFFWSLASFWCPWGNYPCTHLPPGFEKLIQGYDISTLDFLSSYDAGAGTQTGTGKILSNVIKSPVLKLTCTEKKTWKSPSGIRYQIPDQVIFAPSSTSTAVNWSASESNVDLLKTTGDVRRFLNRTIQFSGTASKFSFSSSSWYRHVQNVLTNSSSYVIDATNSVLTARIETVPTIELEMSRLAQAYADSSLRGTFETNREAYERFIDEFGTHFFSVVNFGGMIRTHMEVSKQHVYTHPEEEIIRDAQAAHTNAMSPGSATVSDPFMSATSISAATYYGGDPTFRRDRIDAWLSTIESDPWIISGELKPISDLVVDKMKSSNLLKAINDRAMRRYLEELSREVTGASLKLNDQFLTGLTNRIDALKNVTTTKVLSPNDVETLGTDVLHNLIVPFWFRASTQLCYRWRPDGRDTQQCGPPGLSRHLCAATNSRTQYYNDDTDKGSGGCRMQWGITSSGHPSWFNSVRICYRWYPDGDGGQCGGGASRHLCAPVNGFTGEYRDDTDKRKGGCQMSWSVSVPAEAPLWMKTGSLCYYWVNSGDGQCWGPRNPLCARANHWTSYYRDDTDRRHGHCKMSWGLSVVL